MVPDFLQLLVGEVIGVKILGQRDESGAGKSLADGTCSFSAGLVAVHEDDDRWQVLE